MVFWLRCFSPPPKLAAETPEVLLELCQTIVTKASLDSTFASVYAKACATLHEAWPKDRDRDLQFLRVLLNHCGKEFQTYVKVCLVAFFFDPLLLFLTCLSACLSFQITVLPSVCLSEISVLLDILIRFFLSSSVL